MEEQAKQTFKPIVIKDVFREKSPRLAKFIPGFVYRYIDRILHIGFLNDFLQRNGHLTGIDFVDQTVKEFNVSERIHGLENIPERGRFIFAGNHPLGGFDGMLIMKHVYERMGDLKFLSNDILMNIPNLSPMFIPVNKHGGNSREAAKLLHATYDSDVQILIFPSGLASRKTQGEISDLEWKKHFINKSVKHQRDVIPVFVGGRNTDRFYRLANIRKFLRIKWNLEMFFLPDETMKHRNTQIDIWFGKPIPHATFDRSKTHGEWAQWVKEQVYGLPSKTN